MTEDYTRDIDEIVLSEHAINQLKDRRNMGTHEVKKAISEGDIIPENGDGPHEVEYRLRMPGVDFVMIVDTDINKVETVYYDDEQGADEGGLGGRRFDSSRSI